MNSLRALRKARFTDILDYGIFLFKKHFKDIFIINLMFNIPAMLLLNLFNPVFTEKYWKLMEPTELVKTSPAAIVSSVVTLYAMLFGAVILQGLYAITLKNVMEGAVVRIIYADTVLNRKVTVKQAIKECFGQFGVLLLGRVLYLLIQCAVFLVLYIVLFAGMFALSFSITGLLVTAFIYHKIAVAPLILGILAVLGIIILISLVVGFFIGKYWMFMPAICIEGKKAAASIGRCNVLGKNNFFLIALTFVFGNLLVSLFPMVVGVVFGLIALNSGRFDMELYRISIVIAQIFAEILRPVLICIFTAMYITLRVKREGLDLEMTLWEIEREEAGKLTPSIQGEYNEV
ncbi:hypothetical protein Cst_c23650 [Thermoclostridium stercorarium subsp. stercorarium DSM 8532]|uniref:Glycerophosphoryl diester phosphodiesterase membrane domain-containing protein n=1 Tax=Thermoclostridium stercorarium (strain ATCC 35414 / DSM 8532 / NCIMB 11754) TaxID=1121335 RepID=L7VM83_THES1|nr:hypothetical protein [Thermoclostridium stercorarium]AGC69325.1 hypothetical protein Cst_c23650 [Thermoclostridium stercorarium subsp. stercorarium DSM 8532]AGI40290.1 hypothetical protein Clst_2267 [Thermoclostridium stercorarium subsp. stercorarium DSM 8532]UZQ85292.1 hypothetical protein ODU73_002417 [Thermoclostridium stercorarium]